MGALGSIAGPLTHCCMPPANPDYYQDFPFYNGPCPPCKCEQNNCGNHRCRRHGHCRCEGCGGDHHAGCGRSPCSAAMFSADAPLSVSAGEALPLSAPDSGGDCFESCSGGIRIRRPGLYHVVWTLNLPSYQNFSGRLYLSLNGNEICGSGQTLCCQADNTSASVTGQALVRTGPGGLLSLNSSCDLCIGGGCRMENVAVMTIIRLD